MQSKNLSDETRMAMCLTYAANHLASQLEGAIIDASECRQLAREYKTELAKAQAEVLELKEQNQRLVINSELNRSEALAKTHQLQRILESHGIDIETGEKLPFTK